MPVTLDLNVIALLKEYYGVDDISVLVFKNDSVLSSIERKRVTGKYVVVPMAAYGNGAVTADYTQLSQQVANSFLGIAMQVTPGQLFSAFVLDPKEYLASSNDRGAFIQIFAMRAMLAMDDLRKTLATCFYHTGYLEMGPVVAVDAVTPNLYVDVDPSTAMAISPNSYCMFAATVVAAYRNVNPCIVSSIVNINSGASAGLTRITFTSPYPATVAVGDQLMLKGGRDVALNPLAPVGLGAWLPTVSNRVYGNALWNTAIQANFFGVNRSVAIDRMAGQYILRTAPEKYTDAIIRLLKLCRRGGLGFGSEVMIVVNDDDYTIIMQEALANRVMMQTINNADKKAENRVTQGVTAFQISFSTNWIDKVYDSPYCPRNYFYILDTSVVKLFALSNTEPVFEKYPTNNAPGEIPAAASQGEPTKNIQFLVDDMYTTSEIDLQSGKGLRVDYQLYANFAIINPAHCGVGQFN